MATKSEAKNTLQNGLVAVASSEQPLSDEGLSHLKVTAFRETIGGIEVVDAAFADRLLRAMFTIMERRKQMKEEYEAFGAVRQQPDHPDFNHLKWRKNKSATRLSRAIKAGRKLVDVATGVTPSEP